MRFFWGKAVSLTIEPNLYKGALFEGQSVLSVPILYFDEWKM